MFYYNGMRSEGTSCEVFIMFNVFFIGICMKKDNTSKLTSKSVGRSRIFWIFCMKSVELVMCDSDFSVRVVTFVLGSEISCMSGMCSADNWFEGDVWFLYF